MPRISQTVPDNVVQYRKMLAALRGAELQEIDAEVWIEYMTKHPLESEPGYPKNERSDDVQRT
jgi:hypothetical protein